jgi:hypothetical protein
MRSGTSSGSWIFAKVIRPALVPERGEMAPGVLAVSVFEVLEATKRVPSTDRLHFRSLPDPIHDVRGPPLFEGQTGCHAAEVGHPGTPGHTSGVDRRET